MSRALQKNDRLTTLGFYLAGVPAVFVRNTIRYPYSDTMLGYLAIMNSSSLSSHDFSEESLCDGFAHTITLHHEARHFHDHLLSSSLFELFLSGAKRNLLIMQLAGNISPPPWPSNLNPSEAFQELLTPQGRRVVEALSEIEENYSKHVQLAFATAFLDGVQVTLHHLLETSAIITELLYLAAVRGEPAVENYFANAVAGLGSKYTFLLEHVARSLNSLKSAASVLYFVIPSCLYGSESPAKEFVKLARLVQEGGISWEKVATPDSVARNFENEDRLRIRIERIKLLDITTRREVQLTDGGGPFDGLIGIPKRMYECRSALIDRYVRGGGFSADAYLEMFASLPLPPVVLVPEIDAKGELTALLERELRQHGELYLLRGQDEPEGMVVLIGMVSFPLGRVCIEFEAVDMALMSHYFYQRMFGGSHPVYFPLLDEVYERILKRKFFREGSTNSSAPTGG